MEPDLIQFRRDVLLNHGAYGPDVDALPDYNKNVFQDNTFDREFPLSDEPFVQAWESYARESETIGSEAVLRNVLVQLHFPIRKSISEDRAYRAVTLRGETTTSSPIAEDLALVAPDRIRILVHPTAAGRIGIIAIGDRRDFESIVRAVTGRNEPISIPHSMGATIVSGYNNWERIRAYKRQWSEKNLSAESADWAAEFKRLIPQKHRYQDRFIIVSEGFYSGVEAERLGVTDAEWSRLSSIIRLNHESTHYFTKRVFSSMRNNIFDEVIADFIGIVRACGSYRADWFLRFVGLESYPEYRAGGRLENYRGDPPLGESAFRVLRSLVHAAALNLERIGRQGGSLSLADEGRLIASLSRMTLEEIASDEAAC